MKPRIPIVKLGRELTNCAISIFLCLSLLIAVDPAASALTLASEQQDAALPNAPSAETKIPNEQLDSLVAPIALYPDPLLSQILVASTYPLEIVQLSQWMQKNSKTPKEKLTEEVKKEKWDASVQALVVFPDLVKNLNDNIKWTSDLGNAFLAQQSDVMDAVQRMRLKAKDSGKLKSTEQQKVETKVVESKTVVVIEPSSPDVVYVPSYNPTVVWGAAPYPYPPYYYPPAGYYAAGMALSFGVGMAVGAAWGGGWGWNTGWGGNNDIQVNRNNTFVNNSNRTNRQNVQGGNRSNWQHNPQHRGGAPYSNRATADRYGGSARGDSMASRQASARQSQSSFGGGSSMGSRGDRGGGSAGTMSANRGGGGGDRIGNQSLSSGSGSRGGGAFSSGGSSRSSSMASSSRGSSSMSSRGGGSRGGGGRGGGGGRRR